MADHNKYLEKFYKNNKYLEKFYKNNMSIDEIKNTYQDNKSDIDMNIELKRDTTLYYLTFFERIFLWSFSCGVIYRIHHYFEFV
jgi:hypothetical protein